MVKKSPLVAGTIGSMPVLINKINQSSIVDCRTGIIRHIPTPPVGLLPAEICAKARVDTIFFL